MTATTELTVREAARQVHRAEETIRRWIWSGRLPARKRGNVYYIHQADLLRFARSSRDAPPVVARPSMTEWLAEVEGWRTRNQFAWQGSSADLVLEDRDERAGR